MLEGTAGAPVDLGGYVLVAADDPDLVLVGTGSEVAVCVAAAALLTEEGIATQVSSLPCWDLFAAQPEAHQDAVLPPSIPTLAVEAGSTFGWERWADDAVGIERFGASAPGERVLAELGFTPDNVAARARQLLEDLEDD